MSGVEAQTINRYGMLVGGPEEEVDG